MFSSAPEMVMAGAPSFKILALRITKRLGCSASLARLACHWMHDFALHMMGATAVPTPRQALLSDAQRPER